MNTKIVLILLLPIALIGCKASVDNKLQPQAEKLKHFQAIIDSIYQADTDAVGIMVHIESPKDGISWSGSAGLSDKDKKTELLPDQPALITSSIKPYVAATMLRMVELGLLSIEDPIGQHVTEKTKRLFEADGYDFDKIRIKHLLSHTSGIKDYADSDYLDWINDNQRHRWTRDEQLELTVKVGDPLGQPADLFSYADANFLLCTEIMETVYKQPFYTAMRELLKYEELGFVDTWFPTLEEPNPTTQPLVHQYWGEKGWDAREMDNSFDLYGGGGIATTTKEIAQFSHHFFNGNIIQNSNVLNQIFTKIKTNNGEDVPYCLGHSEGDVNGFRSYGHGGFWGTVVLYFPALDASVAVYVLDRDKGPLRKDILEALVDELAADATKFENVLFRPEFELYKVANSTATLVLFPGGASTAKETREEFKILAAAQANGISVLLMNFNRKLWIDNAAQGELGEALELIFAEYGLNSDKIFMGGMSIGGNVSLSLSNYLHQEKSSIAPEGVFIIDSPIDLHALYKSSAKDVANPDFDDQRLAEPRWIINYFEEAFGKDELVANIQKVAPFTGVSQYSSVPSLKNCKLRFYTEPDADWWMKNRQTAFENTNAYAIQQIANQLASKNWDQFALIETEGKGYRANGERHPHSWSIVDVNELINWIKE